MQYAMMLFSFFVFEWKYPFWANFVQKIKINNLSWNLVPTLIWISKIQWWCSLFLFLIRNTFFGQIWTKVKIISISWNLVPRLFRRWEFNRGVHLFFQSETLLLGKFGRGLSLIFLVESWVWIWFEFKAKFDR